MKIPALKSGSHAKAGKYDNAKRWYPHEEYIVPGSFKVRTPSRAYPFSYLKHFYSAKYSKLLLENNPEKWFALQGLNRSFLDLAGNVEEAIIAALTKEKLNLPDPPLLF